MGCPGDMSTIRCTRSVPMRAFWANFSLSFPRNRLQWNKKIVLPCLDVIRDCAIIIRRGWGGGGGG